MYKEHLSSLEQVKKINLKDKKLLIPKMHPFGAPLLAASFQAFGVDGIVMDTYKGLELGKEYTSSKECFPCQVTLGDVLLFLEKEKNRLGKNFNPSEYVYFMPESDGPCRFGMYNKFHRIVLDSIPEYSDVQISYLSTLDSYDTEGILPKEDASKFKRLAYVTTLVADVFDRILWRVRPYEREKGSCERLIKEYLWEFTRLISQRGRELPFSSMFKMLSQMAKKAKKLIDPNIPRRPQIGIVGEIYLRSHPESNQDIIKKIESLGGEVVNASLGEWLNFVTFEARRKLKREMKKYLHQKRWRSLKNSFKAWLAKDIEARYQKMRQGQVYSAVTKYLDIHVDHEIEELEKKLENKSIYSFEVGTEACLSIAGAITYIQENFHGIVNVFPFTCMPSTICSAILKPILRQRHIPYIDAPYDGTIQPNREIALRTFMYQVRLRQTQLSSI